jgi:short subunit dehydrogenase-like uncharacterized protein
MSQPHEARPWVLYGATGFTGRLILARALELGLRPLLAGRDPQRVGELARAHGLEHRVARVDDAGALTELLRGQRLVLNTAGPLRETAVPLMEACLRCGVRYVDIGGDLPVVREQLKLAGRFRQEGVGAVLAVGFVVVPTDYAAKWVAAGAREGEDGADGIRLGLSLPVRMSRGSARASIDDLREGTLVLKEGVLRRVQPYAQTAMVDYGRGPVESLASTWGDLLTAPLTTGLHNVEVTVEATAAVRLAARLSELLAGPARWQGVRSALRQLVRLLPEGPDEAWRTSQQATIVAQLLRRGEVLRQVRLHTGDPYEFTAASAAKAVQRLLAAEELVGIRSPASVLGDDFLAALPGVRIEPVSRP